METSTLNPYRNKWIAFIGIAFLSFGSYLDYTVVNIALPTIQQELSANLVSLQWVMNIYFLALCVLATVMGRLGDLYGRRRCLYTGAGVFVAASLIAGLSSNIEWLIVGRLFQGVGAAVIFPLGMSLLPQLFPENERGKAVGWLGCMGGVALALGPLLGGLIVTYLGWRWIFFINVPICLIGYFFCFKSVPETKNQISTQVSLDIKGMILLALTMGGIVLSLICSQNLGWTNTLTLSCLVVGMIASVILFKVEKNQENPLVNFSDFKNLLFFGGAILCFLAGVLSAVTLFFDPLYLQIIKGQSPKISGFVLFAIPVAVFLIAFIVGWVINRIGLINTIILGLALACVSALLQGFFSYHSSLIYVVISFIFLGSMWALGNTVSIIAAQTAVGPERASAATGAIVTMFNVGGSIGLTLAVVVYNFITGNSLAGVVKNQQQLSAADYSSLRELVANPANSLQLPMNDLMHNLFNGIFMNGFISVMSFLFLASLVSLLFVLKKRAAN